MISNEALLALVVPASDLTPTDLQNATPIGARAGEGAGRAEAKLLLGADCDLPAITAEAYLRYVVEAAVERGLADINLYLAWAEGLYVGVARLDPRVIAFQAAANTSLRRIAAALYVKKAVLAMILRVSLPSIRPAALGPFDQLVFTHDDNWFLPFAPGEARVVARQYIRTNLSRFRNRTDLLIAYSAAPDVAATLADRIASMPDADRAAEMMGVLLRDPMGFADAVLRDEEDWTEYLTARLAVDAAVYSGTDGTSVIRVLQLNPDALPQYIQADPKP
jgi:hypothetical protein